MNAAADLKAELQGYARSIGLDLFGVTDAEPFDRFLDQIDKRHDHYAERYAYRIEKWKSMAAPREALPGAKSVLVMGFYYFSDADEPPEPHGKMGRIVTYGHLGIIKRARQMREYLQRKGFKAMTGAHRKEAAIRAGLGMLGKHNLVINPKFGSWVAYQSIITDAELEPDTPFAGDLCGDCTKCLQACPTGALVAPRQLDPRKCVTYMLTSRNVPEEHWPHMDNYILGCDACQECCPKNKGLLSKPDVESLLPDEMGFYPPIEMLLQLDEKAFQRDVIGFIQKKISRKGIASAALSNPLIRAAATWFTKKFMKGKEVLPETFVHASGNLEVYKRNAIVAAGNRSAANAKHAVAKYADDPYLGDYARWALMKIEEHND